MKLRRVALGLEVSAAVKLMVVWATLEIGFADHPKQATNSTMKCRCIDVMNLPL